MAQSLYDDARKLVAGGDYAAACPKLEESQRLDPTAVTLFNLADCYEHIGRTASAWAGFLEVAAASKRASRSDRAQVARARADALEPKLARLTIDVSAAARGAGITLKRDGAVVLEGQWGSAVPVDPGKHKLEATAPSKRTWTTEVDVPPEKAIATEVPALADAPSASELPTSSSAPSPPGTPSSETPSAPAQDSHPWATSRTIALVAGGLGVVGVGVGSYFGVTALSKNADAKSSCQGNRCWQPGYDLRNEAVSDGNISTICFGIGAAAIAAGVVLWVTAPTGAPVALAPAIGARDAGATATVAW